MNAETHDSKDWRALAAAACVEKDPAKLLEIVTKLNHVLDEQFKPPAPFRTFCATE